MRLLASVTFRLSKSGLVACLLLLAAASCAKAQIAHHVIRIVPSSEATPVRGQVRFYETDGYPGSVHSTGLRGAASIAADWDITLPADPPGSTRCLEMTTGGIIQYAADVCGTGGSGFYNTMRDAGVDMTQRAALNFVSASFFLGDDAGNDETEVNINSSPSNAAALVGTGRLISTSSPLEGGGSLAFDRTLSCPTCVVTPTSANFEITGLIQSGSPSITQGNINIRTLANGNNGLTIAPVDNSQVADLARFVDSGGTTRSGISPTARLVMFVDPSSSNEVARKSWLDANLVGVANTQTISGAKTFSAGATFNGGIVTGSSTNSTFYTGTNGNLYLRPFAGGDVSCSGVDDIWIGYRTDTNEIQVCNGGVLKKVTLN